MYLNHAVREEVCGRGSFRSRSNVYPRSPPYVLQLTSTVKLIARHEQDSDRTVMVDKAGILPDIKDPLIDDSILTVFVPATQVVPA